VGLELDELPAVGSGSPDSLEPGMVIAVESKFVLPGGGVTGIGNSFLVNQGGLQKLTLFDDAIQVLD
jgi:Xaa-Pro dipeptidase